MNVGLDVGTGFVKVSGNGKRVRFPSLYSCGYVDDGSPADVPGRQAVTEVVGFDAARMEDARNSILVRPVRGGVPFHDRGFAALILHAIKSVGITADAESHIAVGIPYGAREYRRRIEKFVASSSGGRVTVVPQAYGTLLACGKKYGTVINIGHGTTEILAVTKSAREGRSVPRAGEFVTGQLDAKRAGYVNYKRLISENQARTTRLVSMLVDHIADEISQMISGDVILSGGGSTLPGLRELLEKSLDTKMILPDDPVFSNAIGLEHLAKSSQ